ARLGDPDTTDGLGPGFQTQFGDEGQAFFRAQGCYPVDPGRFLALVVLGHLPNREALGRPRTHQETLEPADQFHLPPLGSAVDAPWGRVDIDLDTGPVDVPPFLHSSRGLCAHDATAP